MPNYTVKDAQTGKTITFAWNAPEPPTEADMAEVFQAAQGQAEPSAPAGGMLPTAGSFLGSLAGTFVPVPGARVAGAALGGALGKGAELLLDDKEQSLGEGVRSMLSEGGEQGAYEAAGGLVGKGLKAIAPKIADVALNASKSVTLKTPQVGQTYVDVGKLFPRLRGGVGAVGKRSSAEQAGRLVKESAGASRAAIEAADMAKAAPVRGRQVIQQLRPVYDEAADLARTGKTDTRGAIVARARSFGRQNRAISNTEANRLRGRLDTAADRAFKAERELGQPAGIEAQMDKALAGGLRSAVRTNVDAARPAGAVPLEQMTGRTKDLAGLHRALSDASTRRHQLTRNMALMASTAGVGGSVLTGDPTAGLGSGLGTLGAAYMLTSPRNLGRMALGASGLGTAAEWTPEAIRLAILLSALDTPQQDSGAPQPR